MWVHNNQRVTYTNWSPGEPNNAGGNNHCCMIGWEGRSTWNDLECDGSHILLYTHVILQL